jgi:hypothetical protein
MRHVKYARRLIAATIPAVLYTASMFMPVAIVPISGEAPFRVHQWIGYEVFRAGFQFFYLDYRWDLGRINYLSAWMANPVIWSAFAFIAVGWRRMAVICALAACALALSVFLGWGWGWLVGYPGFWFWWGSMVVTLLSTCFLSKRTLPTSTEDYGPLMITEQKQ